MDPKTLSEAEIQSLILKQQEKPKEKIAAVTISLGSVSSFHTEATKLLSTTVVARVLQHFVDHPAIATWVETGLDFHKEVGALCEFCGQTFPTARLEALEGHFNDQDKELKSALDSLASRLAADIEKLDKLRTPDKAAFYADLSVEFGAARKHLESAVEARRQLLTGFSEVVKSKRARPFERLEMSPNPQESAIDQVQSALTALNAIIASHNIETDEFGKRVISAGKALELHSVADALDTYKSRRKAVTNAVDDCDRLTKVIGDLGRQISKLEQEIAQHVRPAEELNRELRSYLGRDELILKAEKKGYTIMRHGIPARHLSEGEKTAVAFLHFLKSLESKDFNLKTGIVVIDDPVSSLDANALFCAFGFMKDRTKDAGQLFILTHNFGFFQQVRNWFHHKPDRSNSDKKKRSGRFYMLEARNTETVRVCSLRWLDPLLETFQSEYHYLFSRVYEEAHRTAPVSSLAEYYGLPNMARRLLESFLAFRQPGTPGELSEKIETVSFEPAKKARLLRFLHTFSHGDRIAEPEHDLSILSETREILCNLMELVEGEDERHFKAMIALVAPPADPPSPSLS